MAKTRFKYNPSTLNYEKVEITTWDYVKKGISFLVTAIFFSMIIVWAVFSFVQTPKELIQKREIANLENQYNILYKRLENLDKVLADMEERDNNVYRSIFEAEPIDKNIRRAGVGGVNRYKYLEGYEYSDLVINTKKKLDALAGAMVVQSKSLDEIIELTKNKEKMLGCIPAIQPVANKDLKRVASGFGMRIHPVYKIPKIHTGMDFTADTGTEIYATGNGKVISIENKGSGYGSYVIIDHGYGYKTLYGHMSEISARLGQKVKRGDVIGLVGNTGTSVGPHLHYEVIKGNEKVNPVHYYFNDLSPEEYEEMIRLSSNANQSLD